MVNHSEFIFIIFTSIYGLLNKSYIYFNIFKIYKKMYIKKKDRDHYLTKCFKEKERMTESCALSVNSNAFF